MYYEIDYSDSQLSDDEMQFYLNRDAQEAELERLRKNERERKMRNFRFTGGMC